MAQSFPARIVWQAAQQPPARKSIYEVIISTRKGCSVNGERVGVHGCMNYSDTNKIKCNLQPSRYNFPPKKAIR